MGAVRNATVIASKTALIIFEAVAVNNMHTIIYTSNNAAISIYMVKGIFRFLLPSL